MSSYKVQELDLITESLKTQHPSTYFKAHIDAYNFIKEQIEILA